MSQANRVLIFVAVVVIVAAGGVTAWLHFKKKGDEVVATAPAVQAPIPPAPPAEPAIRNPVPASTTPAEPLPALADSDAPLRARLAAVLGEPTIASWLVPESVVRNVVATVDNLPRRKSPEKVRPLKSVPGQFTVARQGAADQEKITLDASTYARYEPLVRIVQGADTQQLAQLYVRWYPLFQEQYEQLGYPGKYFNDRMVEVIDHLLAAPDLKEPVELVQPNVLYEFADPQLEARSSGQKAMMRMGPANAAIVKAKLRELRAAIANRGLQGR